MVRVSRSAEAIPLLVPNDALRRDEARVGGLPSRLGRRGPNADSKSPRNYLMATLLLCLAGAMMYAASSKLSADERADVQTRINDARMVRVALLPDTLLATNHESVQAELRGMSTEREGYLGAFADTEDSVADETDESYSRDAEIAKFTGTTGASCSCACCIGSGCVLGDAPESGSKPVGTEDATHATLKFTAASPAECDATACRSRFTSECPHASSSGIVTARFHAETHARGSDIGVRMFESFETSMVGAVFADPSGETAEDVYAPPSEEDVARAEMWVEKAAVEADEAEAAFVEALNAATVASGLTSDEIAAQAAEAEQAAMEELDAADAPEASVVMVEETETLAVVSESIDDAQAPETSPDVADAPEKSSDVAEAPEASPDVAESPEESPDIADAPEASPDVAEAPEESPADSPEEAPSLGRLLDRLGNRRK